MPVLAPVNPVKVLLLRLLNTPRLRKRVILVGRRILCLPRWKLWLTELKWAVQTIRALEQFGTGCMRIASLEGSIPYRLVVVLVRVPSRNLDTGFSSLG